MAHPPGLLPSSPARAPSPTFTAVMANWGANHGAFVYGHIGKDLITLASMLRIPVSMHNLDEKEIFRPHAWASFGVDCPMAADYNACKTYGPLYK